MVRVADLGDPGSLGLRRRRRTERRTFTAIRVVIVAGLCAGCVSAPPPAAGPTASRAALRLTLSGDARGDVTWLHEVDPEDGCRTASAPFAHVVQNGQTLEVPPGPPSYSLAMRGPDRSFVLRITPFMPSTTRIDTPDGLQLAVRIGTRSWRLPSTSNSKAEVHISIGPGGRSGHIDAGGLEPDTGQAGGRLAIAGDWTCGPTDRR